MRTKPRRRKSTGKVSFFAAWLSRENSLCQLTLLAVTGAAREKLHGPEMNGHAAKIASHGKCECYLQAAVTQRNCASEHSLSVTQRNCALVETNADVQPSQQVTSNVSVACRLLLEREPVRPK